MSKILPFILKKLRQSKGLSQEQLAERARINKQTIFRLEQEQGQQGKTRERTLQQVARALNTEPSVLTGEAPLPDTRGEPDMAMSKFSFLTSTETHNALFLVSKRYDVTHQEVVELAPFLFCCVAEMCLRQRRDRLRKVEIACENAKSAEQEIRHLDSDFSQLEEAFATERRSIEYPDLFGFLLGDSGIIGDADTDHPFALFLADLANETGGIAEFHGYGWRDWPQYRVCIQEAEQLANGDAEVLEDIFEGYFPLNEMPKEIRQRDILEEQAAWVRAKRDEYRQKWAAEVAEKTKEGQSS